MKKVYSVIIRTSDFKLRSEHTLESTPSKVCYDAAIFKVLDSDRVFVKELKNV